MLKQVAKTDKIRELIARGYGDGQVDLDSLAIYESASFNTRPLLRKYGLFAGAQADEGMLLDMAAHLAAGKTVPLQVMHRDALPKGRVFAGETRRNSDGSLGLNTLFYLPEGSGKSEIIRDLDAGVITEVSVGVESKAIHCSACGWDYLSPEATIDNIFECTCANDHTVGQQGTHVKLRGLGSWLEMSLVERGASPGTSVLSRPNQTFKMDEKSGFDRTALRLFASADFTSPRPQGNQEPEKMQELVQAKVDLGLAQANLIRTEAERDGLKTKLEAGEAKVTELTAKLAELTKPELEAERAEVVVAKELIDEFANAALAATGQQTSSLPTGLKARVDLIREARAKLTLKIPAGGASRPAGVGGADAEERPASEYAAFTIRR